jgi:hypothetical protein
MRYLKNSTMTRDAFSRSVINTFAASSVQRSCNREQTNDKKVDKANVELQID